MAGHRRSWPRESGVSATSINKLERGTHRRPRRGTLDLLATALGLAPQAHRDFIALGRGHQTATAATAPAQTPGETEQGPKKCQLPVPPTRLLGRADQLAHALELLARPDVRLLTLVGVGGCGKTHLGIEVAWKAAGSYPDGAWYVSLGPVHDPALIPSAVAHALGLEERGNRPLSEILVDYLSSRHLLLVLDNFEHLHPAALEVACWLQSCPRLQVLVTSRRALHIRGEYELAVPPLQLPDLSPLPALADLAHVPAVELFVERAQASVLGFELTERHASTVAAICHQLDGLPLALELAVPHLNVLSLETLSAYLAHWLDVLTDGAYDLPERQRSLRASLAWSYDLLTASEQRLFRYLAVFAGGAPRHAIESFGRADGLSLREIPSVVEGLRASNLIQTHEGVRGDKRFVLLETIRGFGWDRLTAEGEEVAARTQHALYYLCLAEEAEPLLRQRDQARIVARLDEEHHNFRAALQWLLNQRACVPALRLTAALRPFWYTRGYVSEGRHWLEQALALAAEDTAPVPEDVYGRALHSAGVLAYSQGDFDQAERRYEQSLAISERVGDHTGVGNALSNLGIVAQERGNLTRARDLYERALTLRQELGDRKGVAIALNGLGIVARRQRDLAQALRLNAMSLAIRRELADEQGIAISLINLGNVEMDDGQCDRAESLWEEALAIRRRLEDRRGIAETLVNLAYVAQMRGSMSQAKQLAQESHDMYQQTGDNSGLAWSLIVLATIACLQGDMARAEDLTRRSLKICRSMQAPTRIADCLDRLAFVAWKAGSLGVAAQRLGSSAALRVRLGIDVEARDRVFCESLREQVCDALGLDQFTAACEVGRLTSLEHVLDGALSDEGCDCDP